MYCTPSSRLQFFLDHAEQDFPTFTPEPACNEFDLRLTNTFSYTQDVSFVIEGNVEICINGTFVAICDLGWDNVEAQLACNIAGFGAPFFRKFCCSCQEVLYGLAANIYISGGTALSGFTATAPIGVENVMCPSNATSPAECEAVAPPETPSCYSDFRAAGVRCIQGTSLKHVYLTVVCPCEFHHTKKRENPPIFSKSSHQFIDNVASCSTFLCRCCPTDLSAI